MVRHCCLSIEGAIRNAKDLKGCISVDGKTLLAVAEIRSYMRGQLALGRKVLPMCGCSNFDYQTGCKGHDKPEAWLTLKRIGLNNPTEIEYKGKTLITVGLDIETLVNTWRDSFNLQEENLFVETDKETINALNNRPSVSWCKSVMELLAERNVFLREVEE